MDEEVKRFLDANREQIQRLEKTTMNMMALYQVKFIYRRLKTLEVDLSLEGLFEIEALTCALAVTYARMFTAADGTTKINAKKIPPHLLPVHQQIMELRHTQFAHHGRSPRIKTEIKFEISEDEVAVDQSIHIGMVLGADKTWGPLFDWLEAFIVDEVMGHLARLSNTSGRTWLSPDGGSTPFARPTSTGVRSPSSSCRS